MIRTTRWRAVVVAPLLALLGLTLFAQTPSKAQTEEPPEPPNVLIILTDDQRFDMVQRQVMPEMNRIFGDEGVRFENGVVTTPLCCPSRASIFSGLYAHTHGIIGNRPDFEAWDSNRTMQHRLSAYGYQTAIAGKYFSTWLGPPPDFDRWAIHRRPSEHSLSYYNSTWNVDGTLKEVPIHSTDFTRFQALRFLEHFEADDASPWFMQISPLAPHRPSTPLDRHKGLPVPKWEEPPSFSENLQDKPTYVQESHHDLSAKDAAKKYRKMLRSLMGVDEIVRDVFEWLEAHGESENTLAFFLSDNGFMLGEHGIQKKEVPYEESIRIPFYMRWPARLAPGVSSSIAANVDIAPTVYEATGVPPRYRRDGKSLLSAPPRSELLIEHLNTEDAAQAPVWQGLWNPSSVYVRLETEEREFYDLVRDPYQLMNLLGNPNTDDDPDSSVLDARLDAVKDCRGTDCP